MHTQTSSASGVLLHEYGSLVGGERDKLVRSLFVLAEMDRLRVALEYGYPTTYALLTRRFGHAESSARRRLIAARLIARFPQIARHLEGARLNMHTLAELKEVLEEGTIDDTLERAAGLTQEAVRRLVASMRPRPPVNEVVPPASPPEQLTIGEVAASVAADSEGACDPRPARDVVRPIDGELTMVQLMVPREFLADLEAVRSLLSHKLPCARASQVLGEALRLAKGELLKRRIGSPRKSAAADATTDEADSRGTAQGDDRDGSEEAPVVATDGRHVPRPIARVVWARDGGACAFVGADGARCGSTHQVEFDHVIAYAKGGPTTVTNLRLACSIHNQFLADREFGREYMQGRRSPQHPHAADVTSALKNLGYRKPEACEAVAAVISKREGGTTFEDLIRAALRALRLKRSSA